MRNSGNHFSLLSAVNALLLTALLFTVSAKAQSVVNGVVIPAERVEAFVAELVQKGQKDSPQLRALVKQELIDREILAQEAARRGLDKEKNAAFQIENASQQVLINALVQDLIKDKINASESVKRKYLESKQKELRSTAKILYLGPFWDNLMTHAAPNYSVAPNSNNSNTIEKMDASLDPVISKLKADVEKKEKEQVAQSERNAEEKRLRDRLVQLESTASNMFDDDLKDRLSRTPPTTIDQNLYVLVIGINKYADVPSVPFADRSAESFAELAKKVLGVDERNLILLTNTEATLGRLRSRIRIMLNRLGSQDKLIVYYAGHGVPSKDGMGAYLLAQDGGPGSYEEADLRLDRLYTEIGKSRVGQATLLIDACFSGRSGKDNIVFEGIGGITVTPKHNIRPDSRIAILTAGRGDQFSNQQKSKGHRLFSYHLMKILLEDGPKLTAGEVHTRLRERVLNDSRRIGPEFEQDPELLGNHKIAIKR